MLSLRRGRYLVRTAAGPEDLRRAQALRWLCFVAARRPDGPQQGLDADDLDARCTQVLVEDARSGTLVCCFRLLPLAGGHEIAGSYAARSYDLRRLAAWPGPMVEVGRFCIHPAHSDPDILRLAWGALAAYVDREGTSLLFGCSSFAGTDPEAHADAFALLRARHVGPRRWLPRVKAPDVFRYARLLRRRTLDLPAAQAAMPPLLRTYLLMGGWVSGHAVVDRQLGTLHVFTGLEVGAIPEARKRLLRAVASA